MRLPRFRLRTLMIAVAVVGLILGIVVPIYRLLPHLWVYVFLILAFHMICFGIGFLCLGVLHLFGQVK